MRGTSAHLRASMARRRRAPNEPISGEPEVGVSFVGTRALLLLLPEAQRRAGGGAADHARQAELHLPGGGGGDAAERERALPDLAPGRDIALVARALALELLERGERGLA